MREGLRPSHSLLFKQPLRGAMNHAYPSPVLDLGAAQLAWGARTYIMAIVNVTPDSFSADGLALPGVDIAAAALAQARRAAAEGADILDIGGESTRPGARPIGVAEELR